jgi:pyruvate dehydrogenase E2 component (dihydrolipoamide acetyltransferase)
VEGGRIRATPRARKLAKETGPELSQVIGTGAEGRITGSDVEAFAARKVTRGRSSPLARKLARDAGLDLAAVTGTGPSGRVTREDAQAALAAKQAVAGPAAEAAPTSAVPLSGIRGTIA